jgi:hypothetical protein
MSSRAFAYCVCRLVSDRRVVIPIYVCLVCVGFAYFIVRRRRKWSLSSSSAKSEARKVVNVITTASTSTNASTIQTGGSSSNKSSTLSNIFTVFKPATKVKRLKINGWRIKFIIYNYNYLQQLSGCMNDIVVPLFSQLIQIQIPFVWKRFVAVYCD